MWEVIIKDKDCNIARRCYFSTRHAAEAHKARYKDATVRRWAS
jgi:hypothetical protein